MKNPILLNDAELAALYGLPHSVICLYVMAILPRMDYATGMVGVSPRIAWYVFAEWLHVETLRGPKQYNPPSIWTVMRMAWHLERAGLIRFASKKGDRYLIFECILASRGRSVQNKPARKPQGKPARFKAAPALGSSDKPARHPQAKPASHHINPSSNITTTTASHYARGGGANGKNEAPPLIWPAKVSEQEKTQVQKHLAGLPDAQLVVDELAAGLTAGKIRNPVSWIRTVAEEARAGRFVPEHAHLVRANRERAAASTAAFIAKVERQPTRPMTDAELATLPPKMAAQLRKKRNGHA